MATTSAWGVREAYVLGGEAHETPGHVERVLPRLEHSGEPVEARVGIGVADRLVQGTDDVEVLLPGAVVQEGLSGEGLPQGLEVDHSPAIRVGGSTRGRDRELEHVEGGAGVPVGAPGQEEKRLVVDVCLLSSESPLLVGKGVVQHSHELVLRERLQDHQPRSGQERGVDLERRVLGRRADQDDVARLHVRQQRVLLSLVEPVDLVDEHDRAAALAPSARFGRPEDLAHVLHSREDRAHGLEVGLRHPADDVGKCSLARTRRAPQD